MKKVCFLLALLLLLSSCSGEPIPTQPTDETTTAPTVLPTSTELPFVIPEEFTDREIVTPEEGVMILHGEESIEEKIIIGDVYITANAEVSFSDVMVWGNVYCHGKLTTTGDIEAHDMYAYKYKKEVCSAYDGVHGEIDHLIGAASINNMVIKENGLDYAFETWGKVEPIAEPLKEIRPEEEPPIREWDEEVRILSGKQTLISETIKGDVYIIADGDITFMDVTVYGSVYVYGKLHFSDYLPSVARNEVGYLYAYNFGVTCEAFDGIHGQVTGGPFACEGYVVADDALDYAFDTWGKQ